jgi:hypothetical protein
MAENLFTVQRKKKGLVMDFEFVMTAPAWVIRDFYELDTVLVQRFQREVAGDCGRCELHVDDEILHIERAAGFEKLIETFKLSPAELALANELLARSQKPKQEAPQFPRCAD